MPGNYIDIMALKENGSSYVLITSAKNEETFMRRTLESVIKQTFLPRKWVIVSDGSTDGTDMILKEFQVKHDFIEFLRLDGNSEHKGFASKVFALQEAYARLKGYEYDFIGVLDADISFEPTYYQGIIKCFLDNPKLGISGGYIYEPSIDGVFRCRKTNRERSVAGAIQIFRKLCYENISGLHPLKYGGEDTLAEIMARFYGWEVRAFPNFKVFHYKPGHAKRGILNERIRMGKRDYVLGYHPLYELLKHVRRIKETPFFIGSFVGMTAFIGSMLQNEPRIQNNEIIKYIKKEQFGILKKLINWNKNYIVRG